MHRNVPDSDKWTHAPDFGFYRTEVCLKQTPGDWFYKKSRCRGFRYTKLFLITSGLKLLHSILSRQNSSFFSRKKVKGDSSDFGLFGLIAICRVYFNLRKLNFKLKMCVLCLCYSVK